MDCWNHWLTKLCTGTINTLKLFNFSFKKNELQRNKVTHLGHYLGSVAAKFELQIVSWFPVQSYKLYLIKIKQ